MFTKNVQTNHFFFTIDTTLPADNPLHFRKKNRFIIKMTLTVGIKILNDKIKANEAQYNFDREATKIPVLSPKKLDHYKYPTGENLGYYPGVGEHTKFECPQLGKVFTKIVFKNHSQ